jgi:hypothetical protein
VYQDDGVDRDPLCDEMYEVCDTCRQKRSCDYFASGQVSLCTVVVQRAGVDYPEDTRLDERLERCFEKLMLKSSKCAR